MDDLARGSRSRATTGAERPALRHLAPAAPLLVTNLPRQPFVASTFRVHSPSNARRGAHDRAEGPIIGRGIGAVSPGHALDGPVFDDRTRTSNMFRFIFLNLGASDFLPDGEKIANDAVAILRAEAGRDPYDKTLSQLIRELSTRSDEFRVRCRPQREVPSHRRQDLARPDLASDLGRLRCPSGRSPRGHAADGRHAVGLLAHLGEGPPVPSHSHLEELRRAFESEWCALLQTSTVVRRLRLEDGPPVPVLLATAEQEAADLIVVGSRGVGGFPELLLGSTSHHVAERASQPVLIVPPERPGGAISPS